MFTPLAGLCWWQALSSPGPIPGSTVPVSSAIPLALRRCGPLETWFLSGFGKAAGLWQCKRPDTFSRSLPVWDASSYR